MTHIPLTVGFLPLLDCAPLVAALEKGFAFAEGIELRLVRENSWATLRDRVVYGHFQAAHMLGPMTVASTLGTGDVAARLIAPMALGWGGNAITVSAPVWTAMQAAGAQPRGSPSVQGKALREIVHARAAQGAAPLTFAMVHPFSCHHYELRYWLAACGIDPDVDVQLTVVPPPFMVDALREGDIDGYCVGEPWNTLAVGTGEAHVVTTTTSIWARSPEKVLGMRAHWALQNAAATEALVRAVYRASLWCDRNDSRDELATWLMRPEYVGDAARSLYDSEPDFQGFAQGSSTFPWVSHALWFYSQAVRWKQIPPATGAVHAAGLSAARSAYRPDLYRAALAPLGVESPSTDAKIEDGFFDGRAFDSDDVSGYLAAF